MVEGVPAVALDVLLLLQVVLLTVACVFAAIAALGYRGAPWGRVLRPLPFVLGVFVVTAVLAMLPLPDVWVDVATWLWAVAVVGIAVTVYEFVTLTTGRRPM